MAVLTKQVAFAYTYKLIKSPRSVAILAQGESLLGEKIRRNIWADAAMEHLPLGAYYLVDEFLGPRRDLGLGLGCRTLAIKAWGESAASAVLYHRPDFVITAQVRCCLPAFLYWMAQQPPHSGSSSDSGTRASTADDPTSGDDDPDVPPGGHAPAGLLLLRWLQYIDEL